MPLRILSILVFLILYKNAVALDNILLPFERFEYDIELFIPVVTQEVEFSELNGLTDDMGVYANENRRSSQEMADKMCGQGHVFGHLKVNHKMKKILEAITAKNVTASSNRKMLTDIRDALIDWQKFSKIPCPRKNG
uniref:Uncharacterized protein n=2 Tax=Caenorhabditis japonica TaxID=281687 RepID=A0A8R1J052_CAEJA